MIIVSPNDADTYPGMTGLPTGTLRERMAMAELTVDIRQIFVVWMAGWF